MEALKKYRQFILVKIVPRSNNKDDKIPVNVGGEAIDPHQPINWLPYDEAAGLAALGGYKLGFAITEHDPFFCLDMDACLLPDRSGWSPLAMELAGYFPGAMMEVSHGLDGLHIWGSYRSIPPHKCKNVQLNIELYHEKRFILLGSGQQGDAGLDFSAVLPSVIERYFQPDASAARQAVPEWTSSPVAEWDGPTDDDTLIELMCSSNSAASVFGGTVSFKALWEAEEDPLAKMWPGDGRAYDASSADAALAQRLAFWTGKDCERVLRLMQRSALVREKWERPDYLYRTILAACTRQVRVYSKPTVASAENAQIAGGWVSQADLPKVFNGCVYIRDMHAVYLPGEKGGIVRPDQFNVEFGGKRYLLDEQKSTDDAFKAFTRAMYWSCPKANRTTFRPDLESGAIVEHEGLSLVNVWWPIRFEGVPGDVTRFTDYLHKLLPVGRDVEYLTAWCAAVVQCPGVKFSWAPLLQGTEGNGKTMIGVVLSRAIGERYSHSVNAQDLGGNGGKFNSWIVNKLLVCMDEVYTQDKREILEILKPLITDRRIEVQGKGKDQFTGENRANFLLTSNYQDAIPITENSRRYGVFYTAQQTAEDLIRDGMTEDYFADLWDWLEGRDKYQGRVPGWKHVAYWLKNYPIPNELNPAKGMQRAPKTSSTASAIDSSRGRIEQDVLELVALGTPGFAGGWISSSMFDLFLDRQRLSSKISRHRRGDILRDLGYILHPALPDGRATQTVQPDNARPRLYIKRGHLSTNVRVPKEVCLMYEKAQVLSPTAVRSVV